MRNVPVHGRAGSEPDSFRLADDELGILADRVAALEAESPKRLLAEVQALRREVAALKAATQTATTTYIASKPYYLGPTLTVEGFESIVSHHAGPTIITP